MAVTTLMTWPATPSAILWTLQVLAAAKPTAWPQAWCRLRSRASRSLRPRPSARRLTSIARAAPMCRWWPSEARINITVRAMDIISRRIIWGPIVGPTITLHSRRAQGRGPALREPPFKRATRIVWCPIRPSFPITGIDLVSALAAQSRRSCSVARPTCSWITKAFAIRIIRCSREPIPHQPCAPVWFRFRMRAKPDQW